VYGTVIGVGEFNYANKNFRETTGVAIATKFTQTGQNAHISVLYAIYSANSYMLSVKQTALP